MKARTASVWYSEFRRAIVTALLVTVALLVTSSAQAHSDAGPKRVLVLYWYNKDYPGNILFDQNLQEALNSAQAGPIEYYPEYLESNRFPGEKQSLLLRDYLKNKYADREIDVVIAVSDPPLEFLLKYRGELFPEASLVFVAVKCPTREQLQAGQGITGILPANTHKETIELALRLHPNTQEVFVISGTLEGDKRWEGPAREVLKHYEDRVKITYLTDLPLNNLIATTGGLPDGSIVLWLWQQSQNDQGKIFESADTLGLISNSTPVPIYGMASANIGHGLVGGFVHGSDTNATKVAEIVLRLFNGVRAQDIPVENAPFVPMFDWRQLRRWNISEESLPVASIVRFREPTFWQQNRWRIIAVGFLLLLQTVYIALLLFERRRRRESAANYLSIFNSVNDAIFVHDVESQSIVDVNSEMCSMFGWTAAEIKKLRLSDISSNEPPYTPTEALDFLKKAINGEPQVFDWKARDRSGRLFWVEVSLTSSVIDGKERVLGVVRDITERKQAEWTIRESEERFRTMADTAPVMIWVAAIDKQRTYFNRQWLEFTGRRMEEGTGYRWADDVHSDDLSSCLETYNDFSDLRIPFSMEYRLRRTDGQFRWVYDSGTPRFSADGKFLGYIGSCIDITDHREAEEALEDLSGQLIRAREEECARIARELHDDLSQGMALVSVELEQLSLKPPDTDVELRSHLKGIFNQIGEISKGIHRMSYDLHPSKLSQLGLVTTIAGLCNELRKSQGLHVEFSHAEVPVLSREVSLCLYRITQECLNNIVKHSGALEARVNLGAIEGRIQLRVSDEGTGFDIDSPQSKKGLGLVSMRERLRLVDGSIHFDSRLGQGTEIEVTIPLESKKRNHNNHTSNGQKHVQEN